jgi:hypothetical protein
MDTNITICTDNGKKNLWNILFSVCLLLLSNENTEIIGHFLS